MATLQEEFKEDIGNLLESGFLAIKQGDEESAKKIFNAIDVLDESGIQKKFGYGLISLHKMETKNAIQQFEEILQKDKNNYRAQAFLSFAYVLSAFGNESSIVKEQNLKKAIEMADYVLAHCDDASTRAVAQSILDWEEEIHNKELKKNNSSS